MTNLSNLAALVAATLAITLASPAYAQQSSSGGATDLTSGNGFGCAAGTTYQMVNGIARCTQPTATTVAASSCSVAVLTQGACSFSFPSSTSGSTPAVSTNTPGYTGAARATCTNGSWTGLAGTCGPNPCNAATATYGLCSFDLPAVASGSSPSVSTSTAGYTGTGQATCSAGAWSTLTASCAPSNCGGTVTSYGSCTFAVPALSSGASTSVTTPTSGYTGSITASCSTGSLSFSSQSCAAVPPPPSSPCASGTMTWTGTCSAPITATSSGSSRTLTNTASGYTGSVTFACSNGVWGSPSGVSCNPTGQVLVACPANIWIRSTSVSLPLSNANPSNKLPNGNAYCLYQLKPPVVSDRMAGVFDRVVGKAVDFFPIFQEYPDSSGNTSNSTFAFLKYEPRYSNNLHVQGAYCANNTSDPNQSGFYPGTCITGGAGGFGPMCFVQLDPGSSLGSYMQANGLGNRLKDGGSEHWGAYDWATLWVDDGTNTWSEGGLYSTSYGWYTGGGMGRCMISSPQNEAPVANSDNPPPMN